MDTIPRPRLALPRRLPGFLLALVIVGSFAVGAPTTADGYTYTYRTVASLPWASRVDRVTITRVGINVPIKNGVIGATLAEHVAYHYPGTSWPGGHSNTYLYGHARVGTFLNLWKVRVGDIVRLHLTTGGWLRYRVTIVRKVAWNDGRWTLLTSSERLTLQTCTSYYSTAAKFVVVAVPLY